MKLNSQLPLLDDLLGLCSFVNVHAPVVEQDGRLTPEDSKLVIQSLKPEKMVFERQLNYRYWLNLLMDLSLNSGLLVIHDGFFRVGPSCEYFLSLDSASRVRYLASAWWMTNGLLEWSEVPRVELDLIRKVEIPEGSQWRQNLVSAIMSMPVGQWISVVSLLQSLRHNHPAFFRENPELYSNDNGNGQERWRCRNYVRSWENNEARAVCFILKFPLRWMGFVRVCDAKDLDLAKLINPNSFIYLFQGYPTKFLITKPGKKAIALEQLNRSKRPNEKNLVLTTDNVIEAPDSISSENKLHLELLTESYNGCRRCTPEAIWRALEVGIEPEFIIQFFSENVSGAETMIETIRNEWIPRYGELKIYKIPALIVTRSSYIKQLEKKLKESDIPFRAIGESAMSIPEGAVDHAKLLFKSISSGNVDRFGAAELIQSRTPELMDEFMQSARWKGCIAKRIGRRHALLKSRVWRRCKQDSAQRGFSIIFSDKIEDLSI